MDAIQKGKFQQDSGELGKVLNKSLLLKEFCEMRGIDYKEYDMIPKFEDVDGGEG